MRSDPGYARKQVAKRDQGVCAGCGLDTRAARRIWEATRREEWEDRIKRKVPYLPYLPAFKGISDASDGLLVAWGIMKPFQSWWENNHCVPVVEGGGLCGLEGYETLCQGCHRIHTAALRKRMAAQRRAEREP